MCMLSLYPPGIQPDPEHLLNGARINRDGFGYAIITGTTRSGRGLLTGKSMTAPDLVKQFCELREQHPEGPALFHSRLSTGGLRNTDNCHPFTVSNDDKTVLAHNGVLFSVPRGESRSDTRIFAEDMFPKYRRLDKGYPVKDGYRFTVLDQIAAWAGARNKIMILTANKRYRYSYYMINDDQGWWLDTGEWHSNRDYMGKSWWGHDRGQLNWGQPAYSSYYTRPATTTTTYNRTGYQPSVVKPATEVTSPVTGNLYAWRNTQPGQCPVCNANGFIDKASGICDMCNYCVDCEEYAALCMCYSYATAPSRLITGGATKYGDDNDTPVVIGSDGKAYTEAELAAIEARFIAAESGVTDTLNS